LSKVGPYRRSRRVKAVAATVVGVVDQGVASRLMHLLGTCLLLHFHDTRGVKLLRTGSLRLGCYHFGVTSSKGVVIETGKLIATLSQFILIFLIDLLALF